MRNKYLKEYKEVDHACVYCYIVECIGWKPGKSVHLEKGDASQKPSCTSVNIDIALLLIPFILYCFHFQFATVQSQISRAITLRDASYSKVAAACFESLGRAIVPPSSSVQATHLTTNRKLLYQSQGRLYTSEGVISAMFTDIFQTLAADPEISVTDLSYPQESTKNVRSHCVAILKCFILI